MRSVFTSQRLENVEAVAKMLEDAGIQVKVSNDRSYKGKRRSNFSYRDSVEKREPDPQVWVIKAEDQHKARAMLREQGLIESTRQGFGYTAEAAKPSYLPTSAHAQEARRPDRRASLVMRARLFVLALIALLTILTMSGVLHR